MVDNFGIVLFIVFDSTIYGGKIVYQQGRYTKKCNKVFSFMAMAVLILVAGLRNGIGDTEIYMEGFKTAPSTIAASIKMLVNKSMKDRGFYFIEGIIKTIKDDEHFFILLYLQLQ